MDNIYFDHAATTPVHPQVEEAMKPYFDKYYGNPSSVHSFGQDAARAITRARKQVAELIGTEDERKIIFTSGGTESDNLAIKGTAMALRDKGKHIITSSIEHHAVLETCEWLEKYLNFEVTYIPVDENGFVDPEEVRNAIKDETILITIMMANNEIGTIEPIAEIGKIAEEKSVYFHTDAVQAIGQIPVDVNELKVDLLSLSAHKFNGPKGIGALYVDSGVKLVPQMSGGNQERKKRASTENVPGIVGLGEAAVIARENLEKKSKKLKDIRDYIIEGIRENIDDIILNGPEGDNRLPGNVNFCFKYVEGESILLNLDGKGVAASSGSACTSGSLEPSHVLQSVGLAPEVAHGSLRISLGLYNTREEAEYFIDILPDIIARLREMSALYEKNAN
ncbi:MAG: cysteine desulfurase NifS [Bacillota bacterium]